MKKILAGTIVLLSSLFCCFAGDSAVFVDNGFSKDGSFYIFGQYGRTDKNYRGWAEIYTVDVAKNDYVDSGVFRDAYKDSEKNGKEIYEQLYARNNDKLKKYECSTPKPDQVLYIREDDKKNSTDEIVFKDFVGSLGDGHATYHVDLVQEVTGSGLNVRSSFFIMVEKQDLKGNVLARQKFGNPSITRKGVSGYRIERIVCDNAGKSLVFVVEKTMVDKTGINIRYMIETGNLNLQFHSNMAPKDESEDSAEKLPESKVLSVPDGNGADLESSSETLHFEIANDSNSELSDDEPIILENVSTGYSGQAK